MDESRRGTGQTTGLILKVMAIATLEPDTWVPFVDHYRPRCKFNQTNFGPLISSMSERLGLEYKVRFFEGSTHVIFPLREIKARRKPIT